MTLIEELVKKTRIYEKGESFYYANRDTKQVEKCTVIEVMSQYPQVYIAKKEDTGEIFECYHGYGCFKSEKEAFDDAQIEADRIIY